MNDDTRSTDEAALGGAADGNAEHAAGIQAPVVPQELSEAEAAANLGLMPATGADGAITLTVNGETRSVQTEPMMRLLDALRGPLKLTGTKEGCGEGECGTCAVLLDGELVNACLIAIGQCHGREVTTVEGIGDAQHLTPIQQCMSDHGGAQCGICTPGMIISAEALLRRNRDPSSQDIRLAIAGNLCRCTGYERIVQSILVAARMRKSSARSSEPKGTA